MSGIEYAGSDDGLTNQVFDILRRATSECPFRLQIENHFCCFLTEWLRFSKLNESDTRISSFGFRAAYYRYAVRERFRIDFFDYNAFEILPSRNRGMRPVV